MLDHEKSLAGREVNLSEEVFGQDNRNENGSFSADNIQEGGEETFSNLENAGNNALVSAVNNAAFGSANSALLGAANNVANDRNSSGNRSSALSREELENQKKMLMPAYEKEGMTNEEINEEFDSQEKYFKEIEDDVKSGNFEKRRKAEAIAAEESAKKRAEDAAREQRLQAEKKAYKEKLAKYKKMHGESTIKNLSIDDLILWGEASIDADGDHREELLPLIKRLKTIQYVISQVNSGKYSDNSFMNQIYQSTVSIIDSAKFYLQDHKSMVTWTQKGRDRKAFCRTIISPAFWDKIYVQLGVTKNTFNNKKDQDNNHRYTLKQNNEGDTKQSVKLANRIAAARASLLPVELSEKDKEKYRNDPEGLKRYQDTVEDLYSNRRSMHTDKEGNANNFESYVILKAMDGATPDELLADKKFRAYITEELKKENLETGLDFFKNRADYETGSISQKEYINNVGKINALVERNDKAFVEELLNGLLWEENKDTMDMSKIVNDKRSGAWKKREREAYKVALLQLVHEIRFDPNSEDSQKAGLQLIGVGEEQKVISLNSSSVSDLKKKQQRSGEKKDYTDNKRLHIIASTEYDDATKKIQKYDTLKKQYTDDVAFLKANYSLDEVNQIPEPTEKSYDLQFKDYSDSLKSAEKELNELYKTQGVNKIGDLKVVLKEKEDMYQRYINFGIRGFAEQGFYEDFMEENAAKEKDNDKDGQNVNEKQNPMPVDQRVDYGYDPEEAKEQIEQLKNSIINEDKIIKKLFEFKSKILLVINRDYADADKDKKVKEKTLKKYDKKLAAYEGMLRKQCGGLDDAEEKKLCDEIIEKINSGSKRKKNETLNVDLVKLIHSYALRFQEADDEGAVTEAISKLLKQNVWYGVDGKVAFNMAEKLKNCISSTWRGLHKSYTNLLQSAGNGSKKVHNDAVKIQANKGDYSKVLEIYNGVQSDVAKLNDKNNGEKNTKEAYQNLMQGMASKSLDHGLTLDDYIAKGNSDFTEFMSMDKTNFSLDDLKMNTIVEFGNRENETRRKQTSIEKFMRLVAIEKMNGERISDTLLAGGSDLRIMKIAEQVHKGNMAYINSIDSLFKKENGFSLVDMTFVDKWMQFDRNDQFLEESVTNRRKYEDTNKDVSRRMINYSRGLDAPTEERSKLSDNYNSSFENLEMAGLSQEDLDAMLELYTKNDFGSKDYQRLLQESERRKKFSSEELDKENAKLIEEENLAKLKLFYADDL